MTSKQIQTVHFLEWSVFADQIIQGKIRTMILVIINYSLKVL